MTMLLTGVDSDRRAGKGARDTWVTPAGGPATTPQNAFASGGPIAEFA